MLKSQHQPQTDHPHSNFNSSSNWFKHFLLFFFIPIFTFICLTLWFISFFLSFLPFLNLFSIPLFIFISFFLIYLISSIPYLLFAQVDPPEGYPFLVLPFSPIRSFLITKSIFSQFIHSFQLGWIELILDYSYRRIIILGHPNARQKLFRENLIYDHSSSSSSSKRLDIYLPIDWSPISRSHSSLHSFDLHHPTTTDFDSDLTDSDSFQIPPTALAPVIVFLHPGNWSFTSKRHYIQLALRFRRLGFCVVVPDFTQFPEGRCQDSIADIRKALAWVQRSAHQYGGDGNRVYLLGHGSGAHLALLTVVQDAVVHSRDDPSNTLPIPSGLNQLNLSTPSYDSSHQIKGLILLSGIYDPIKQVRTEAKSGWEMISSLRRALGPSHPQTLLNSPTHLLFASKEFLKLDRLPSKVLFIHGGRDRNVPILQSVLCKTLLIKLGVKDVRLRAYRELAHLDSLFSIMIEGRRYGDLIDSEIISLVTS
ncbi:lipase [Melampsora americana]|nr:lipase [Melampsora americana]